MKDSRRGTHLVARHFCTRLRRCIAKCHTSQGTRRGRPSTLLGARRCDTSPQCNTSCHTMRDKDNLHRHQAGHRLYTNPRYGSSSHRTSPGIALLVTR